MSDFLLELRCEEVPARMQAGARADLEKLFRKEMDAAGVSVGEVTVWSTPRRLALIARGLPVATSAVSEELKGPRVGAPPQALEGFLRKTGLSESQLTERDGVLYAVTEKPGRATAEVLAEAIPAIIRAFPWPKSMRWGAASLSSESPRWVRPLSGIVALLGGEVVPCSVGDVVAGRETLGHRFHSSGAISINDADDYAAKLRAAHVLVDHTERQDLIRKGAALAATDAGLTLVEDEGLVIENAGLTEWPVPLLGRFDEAFLAVPPEVIQLTARTNQKYFVCESSPAQAGASGSSAQLPEVPACAGEQKLANAFICTANIAASDGGAAIIDGNRKVLAARLSDARFFWEQDRKKTLAQHAEGLARITFHEKLGSVADKVERVAKLARWLVEEGIVKPPQNGEGDRAKRGGGGSPVTQRPDDSPLHHPADGPPPRAGEELADQAELAARLCKADLVTEMVGEFPELQGLMGGYYARAEGLPDAVADAIRDHYKPVGQGDDVPTAPVTVAVSLADKLDTLVGFLVIDEYPTGSRDPFALRRAAFSILRIIQESKLRFQMKPLVALVIRNLVSERISNRCGVDPRFSKYIEIFWSNYPEANSSIAEVVNISSNQYGTEDGLYLRDVFLPYVSLWYYRIRNIEGGQSVDKIVSFVIDRIRSQSRALGTRPDIFESAFALAGARDLYSLILCARELNMLLETADGTNLLAGYKRAANILKKENYEANGAGGLEKISLSYTPEPAEKALMDALSTTGPQAAAAVAAEDFAGAMAALATLRAPIDAFFDDVTVNDADPDKREARLGLLARFRDAVHSVADFSRIEG